MCVVHVPSGVLYMFKKCVHVPHVYFFGHHAFKKSSLHVHNLNYSIKNKLLHIVGIIYTCTRYCTYMWCTCMYVCKASCIMYDAYCVAV